MTTATLDVRFPAVNPLAEISATGRQRYDWRGCFEAARGQKRSAAFVRFQVGWLNRTLGTYVSYYTRLELSWDDGDHAAGSLSDADILRAARPFIEANGWDVDHVLADLAQSVSGGGLDRPGYNRISAFELIAMIESVSRAFPQVVFYARGIGEDYFDIWARQFRDGNMLLESGPIDPDA